jgi:signal transduction histidine kinase
LAGVGFLFAGPLYSCDTLRVPLGQGDDTIVRMEKALGSSGREEAVDTDEKTRAFIAIRGMRHGGTVFDPGRFFIAAISALSTIIETGNQGAAATPAEVLKKVEALDTDMRAESGNIHRLLQSVSTDMEQEISPDELKRLGSELVKLSDKMKYFAAAMDALAGQIEGDDREIMSIAMEDMALTVAVFEDRINFINKDVKKKKQDINNVINDARAQYQDVTFDPEALPEAEINSFMIQGAIANILKNNETVEGIHHTHIDARVSEDGRDVIIEISDDGPGFPEEFLTQKQGKAYQEAFEFGSTKRDGGTGFGLAETRWYIMEDHGGDIYVDSLNQSEIEKFNEGMHINDWPQRGTGGNAFDAARKELGEKTYRQLTSVIYNRLDKESEKVTRSLYETAIIIDSSDHTPEEKNIALKSFGGLYEEFMDFYTSYLDRNVLHEDIAVLSSSENVKLLVGDIRNALGNRTAQAYTIATGFDYEDFEDIFSGKDFDQNRENLEVISEWVKRQAMGFRTDRTGATFIIRLPLSPASPGLDGISAFKTIQTGL